MTDLRIEVTEPVLVRNRQGEPVGRLQPGRRYRAHSVGPERVVLKGPDGSLGAVPRRAVTLVLIEPAPAPQEPSGGAAAPTPTGPTRRELRKDARWQRQQDKRQRREQAQAQLAGANSSPSKVKVGKGGLIVAFVVVVLLAAAGGIAAVVATRGQVVEPGWWQHVVDEDLGDPEPALDLVLLIDEDEQVVRGEARYDNGELCFIAVFADESPDPDADGIAATGYGHFCDEDTLVEMDLPDLTLRDGLLVGDFTTYAVVEGERSIVIVEGRATLEQRGAPDSADRMEQPSTWAPTSAEGQPARVAKLLDPDLDGEPATGYLEVMLCPFGRLRYWQDQRSGDERVVGAGAGQIDASREGSLLVNRQSPGEPPTGEAYIVAVDDEQVVLFAPDGPIVLPLTNDTTRRCGI